MSKTDFLVDVVRYWLAVAIAFGYGLFLGGVLGLSKIAGWMFYLVRIVLFLGTVFSNPIVLFCVFLGILSLWGKYR